MDARAQAQQMADETLLAKILSTSQAAHSYTVSSACK
jgi:hypothetical protein